MKKIVIFIGIILLFSLLFGCTDTKQNTINDLNIQLIQKSNDLNNLQTTYQQLQSNKTILEFIIVQKDQNYNTLQQALNILNLQDLQKSSDFNNLQNNYQQLLVQKQQLDILNNQKDQNYNNVIAILIDKNNILNDINIQLVDKMLENKNLKNDLNELYVLRNYNLGGYIDKDFNYCAIPTTLDLNGGFKYAAIPQKKTIRLYNNINTYFNQLYYGEYYDQNTIFERTNNQIQSIFLDNIYLFNSDSRYSSVDDSAFDIISLVQEIPYDNTSVNYNIAINKYPYNVLYNKVGICAEKSYLLVSLLSKLGYGTGIFLFGTHAAAGIKCPPQYDYKDSGYCLIESTILSLVGEYQDSNSINYNSYEGIIVTSVGKDYELASAHYAEKYSSLDELYYCR